MPQEPAADLVIRGAAVTTVDPARPTAAAVAVRGGRIAAVGSDADVAGLIGARTRVVEGRGRTVLPGFQDAHVHPPSSGLDELLCDVREPTGELPLERAALVDRIRTYAAAHPDAPWILGSGWYMGDFPNGTPHRRDLDVAVGGRPAYLPNRDGHSAWVSTRALELAGIGPGTPDPPLGRIERDSDGTPSGVVHEAAMDFVEGFIPPATQADFEAGLLRAQAKLHALGVTSWQDAIVGPVEHAAYLAVAGRGALTARVVGAQWWEADWDERAVDGLLERRTAGTIGRYRAGSVKVMVDGVLETFTGAMLEPYLPADGGPADRTGILFLDPDRLRGVTRRLDAAGFQVHFHAIGDRAVREALDAVEAARAANGPTDGAPPHCPHPGHPPGRRAALRRPRGRRQRPAVLGRSRAPDGPPDHSVPRPRAKRLAVPVQVAPPIRRAPGHGLGLERVDRGPAARDGDRGQPRPPDRGAGPPTARA